MKADFLGKAAVRHFAAVQQDKCSPAEGNKVAHPVAKGPIAPGDILTYRICPCELRQRVLIRRLAYLVPNWAIYIAPYGLASIIIRPVKAVTTGSIVEV